MGDPNKRRKRAKEKAKDARRRKSKSPWSLEGSAEYECYINADWMDAELAGIEVLRRTPAGGLVLSAFLVDFLCLGLKDAFQELDLTREEFLEKLDQGAEMYGAELVPVDIQTVRRLVAAAIRWSQEHNFRLPRDWERGVKLIGGVGDVATADISEFGTEDGGLLYVGQQKHLRNRLIGTTLEEFMSRPEVSCEFYGSDGEPVDLDEEVVDEESLDEPDMDDEGAEAITEAMDEMRDRLVDKTRQWCFANRQAPHPKLREAADALVAAMLSVPPESVEEMETPQLSQEKENRFFQAMRQMISLEGTPEEQEQMRAALGQLMGYVGSFSDPQAMLAELGWEMGDEDEEFEGEQ